MSGAAGSRTWRETLEGTRHFCFDKDGTLTDVHPYWSHTCRLRAELVVERFSRPRTEVESLMERMGIDVRAGRVKPGGPVGFHPRATIVDAVAAALAAGGAPVPAAEIAAAFAEIDRRQQESGDYRIEILPGVREFLGFLRCRGAKLSIYSSDRKENLERVLERLSLGGFFQEIVGGGCVARPKPDPEGFRRCCQAVGVVLERSAYIGDTLDDLRMAAAGAAGAAVGVGTGVTDVETLRAHTPWAFRDLREAVREANEDAEG